MLYRHWRFIYLQRLKTKYSTINLYILAPFFFMTQLQHKKWHCFWDEVFKEEANCFWDEVFTEEANYLKQTSMIPSGSVPQLFIWLMYMQWTCQGIKTSLISKQASCSMEFEVWYGSSYIPKFNFYLSIMNQQVLIIHYWITIVANTLQNLQKFFKLS